MSRRMTRRGPLTAEEVGKIVALSTADEVTTSGLAVRFGVSISTIQNVIAKAKAEQARIATLSGSMKSKTLE